ncbi:MAG: heavy-metal-associated domain-containing protein [Betaproteobacteria bacterium]|jgi:copper chaperone CopZ|nr:heavy-metal-associated domain-containing protein [Betaproteobacteria bacterium]MCH1425501.1 heavy-metal-associated domain-containing protein [Burkholderiales bacterium]MDA0360766.1 heavy metal-associated domain-containing protein [Pseudomonadota bacterium]MBT6411888.1 heavy-metal-associated domain-containing protein [Betaproteobacteria bacterium]MDA0862679.1 heavy metal-associated domain-containing protein [Pseudomonadota bacterium]|tara:strand:+ start:155 stop:451 length:297 start_codon:yes stop_codon:yes gene_type:complete
MNKLLSTVAILIALSATAHAAHPGGTIYAGVNGLVCDFCARALEKTFGKEEAVEFINVDLDEKIITIHLNEGQSLDNKTVLQLITDAGYDVRDIRYGE